VNARRPLRAWRSGFDLAVEVFRLTSGLDDVRTNGFVRRLRDAALRVPALVARAAHRGSRGRCRADLREAQRTLDEVAADGEWLRALVYIEPDEAAALAERLAAARKDLLELDRRLAPGNRDPCAARPAGAVEGGKHEV
jgi:four helix bundle protein